MLEVSGGFRVLGFWGSSGLRVRVWQQRVPVATNCMRVQVSQVPGVLMLLHDLLVQQPQLLLQEGGESTRCRAHEDEVLLILGAKAAVKKRNWQGGVRSTATASFENYRGLPNLQSIEMGPSHNIPHAASETALSGESQSGCGTLGARLIRHARGNQWPMSPCEGPADVPPKGHEGFPKTATIATELPLPESFEADWYTGGTTLAWLAFFGKRPAD